MRKFFLFLIAFVLLSFAGVSSKKRISDSLFRYEFYTTDEVVVPKPHREYFWFKGGSIHNTEYGAAGELLHNEFFKFYHDNQLAEAGEYNNGLKKGYWKNWFKSGILQSKVYWDEGQMDGSYLTYDHTGKLIEEGKYKNNKKHGRWINYISGDTLKFRNGEIIIKKIKVKDTLNSRKPGLFKRIFGTKSKDSVAGSDKEIKSIPETKKSNKKGFFNRIFSGKNKENKEQDVKEKKAKATPEKKNKDSFLKRLFSKKDKKQNGNGKSQ